MRNKPQEGSLHLLDNGPLRPDILYCWLHLFQFAIIKLPTTMLVSLSQINRKAKHQIGQSKELKREVTKLQCSYFEKYVDLIFSLLQQSFVSQTESKEIFKEILKFVLVYNENHIFGFFLNLQNENNV